MGRNYVASTPATRGEVEEGEDVTEDGFPADMTEDEVRGLLEDAAAKLGLRLVPIGEPEGAEDEGKPGSDPADPNAPVEPARNGTTEAWADYAKAKGATDAELVDEQGEALGRDALIEKYASKSA